MSVSMTPHIQTLLLCVKAVQSSKPTKKGKHWFFFPWITRLDWLGCLPDFDCFLSLWLSVQISDAHIKIQNVFTQPWMSVKREDPRSFWPAQLSAGWLTAKCPMTKCIQSQSRMRGKKKTPKTRRQISAAISVSFDWLSSFTSKLSFARFW